MERVKNRRVIRVISGSATCRSKPGSPGGLDGAAAGSARLRGEGGGTGRERGGGARGPSRSKEGGATGGSESAVLMATGTDLQTTSAPAKKLA